MLRYTEKKEQRRLIRMLYRRDKAGNELSALGFGCMRFAGGGTGENFQAASDQVMAAIGAGVNYLDTAYVYRNNEKVLGRILAENKCRDRVYIATKLPQYLVRSVSGAQKMFAQELEWLQTDWVDYYLLHMLYSLYCSLFFLYYNCQNLMLYRQHNIRNLYHNIENYYMVLNQ